MSILVDEVSDACMLPALVGVLLAEGTSVRFIARGSSMNPVVRDGDVLEIEPCSADALHLGDIVVYASSEQRLTVHRLRRRRLFSGRSRRFGVRGDNQAGSCVWINAGEVLGKAICAKRGERVRRLDTVVGRLLGWVIGGLLNGR